ncbi:alcohol oxidase [Tilletiopsis washingtonensis]|uniref:Alcohol oxidase n=1 Tax=Tilletiopsis washingtonensis TaxID=58919 RepID=A0A316Z7T9_9BASI|nr:alcohol oxidase [Tilletiopsis washingtonensis]PWN97048.1 alcohol oxidase [Tilletiopsis washingtonensis]
MKVTVAVSLLAVAPFALAAPSWPSPPSDAAAERRFAEQLLASRALQATPETFAQQPFDYLVLGGGTAGLAVAARLSEQRGKRVGVLEAGPSLLPNKSPVTDTPGFFGGNLGSDIDYKYATVAQDNGVPSVGWPRGRVLGGSSALNFLVWDRAAEAEYDAWEELGNKGWNWDNMYRYMKKAEHFFAPSAADQQRLHLQANPSDYGRAGPVQVSYPRYISDAVTRWIPALEALGIRKNNSPLAGDNRGASVQPSNINPKNSTRSYSAPAYFAPASGRENLVVLTEAVVQKIEFGSSSSKKRKADITASGVTYTARGKTYMAKLKGGPKSEVIVSGGSVNSPQILELSGIGSKAVLDKIGVPQLVELPGVGENMQDHTYSAAAYELKAGSVTLDNLRNDPAFAADQQQKYNAGEVSILDETVPAIGYLTLTQLVGAQKAAQLVVKAKAYVASAQTPYKATLRKQLEFLEKHADTITQMEVINVDGYFAGSAPPAAGKSYTTYLAAQQHLLSRGSIHAVSKDPSVSPAINANYFTAEWDLDVATAGTEYLRRIAATQQYQDNFIVAETLPGAGRDVRDYTKKTTVTEYHPIATCSMLPRSQGGVVDAALRVYGTRNVRVVDASVIPLHISAHIQATIYGVAEAGAAIIAGGLSSLR